MYAIDWIQADGQGRVCYGDCSRNDLWPIFGAPLLAVAEGTVVLTSDGAPDIPPLSGAQPRPVTSSGETVSSSRSDHAPSPSAATC